MYGGNIVCQARSYRCFIGTEIDLAAYKKICTHAIQPSASSTLDRLGLIPAIESAGGVRNHRLSYWARWGWIIPPRTPDGSEPSTGYNIRREVFDPMLHEMAANTPGVELMPGHAAQELLKVGGRVAGVRMRRAKSAVHEIRARLVVAADGRNSAVAELAGLPVNRKKHGRFRLFCLLPRFGTGGARNVAYLVSGAGHGLQFRK